MWLADLSHTQTNRRRYELLFIIGVPLCSANAAMDQRKLDAVINITVCKAEYLVDAAAKIKKKPPRQNVLGEVKAYV